VKISASGTINTSIYRSCSKRHTSRARGKIRIIKVLREKVVWALPMVGSAAKIVAVTKKGLEEVDAEENGLIHGGNP